MRGKSRDGLEKRFPPRFPIEGGFFLQEKGLLFHYEFDIAEAHCRTFRAGEETVGVFAVVVVRDNSCI